MIDTPELGYTPKPRQQSEKTKLKFRTCCTVAHLQKYNKNVSFSLANATFLLYYILTV